MPKSAKIKWRQEDRNAIARTVAQFNAKLTRTLKAHPEWAPYLPSRLNSKEIQSNIDTRSDFNRTVNSYKRFLRPGAEAPYASATGIHTTNWERREIGIKIGIINRRRARELKLANVSTFKGTMGSIQENNLRPKKYDINKIKATDWEKFVESVEKQASPNYNRERLELYKENYKNAIFNTFGNDDKAQELLNLIDSLSPEFLFNQYYDDPLLEIGFIYDPLESSLILNTVLDRWTGAIENETSKGNNPFM